MENRDSGHTSEATMAPEVDLRSTALTVAENLKLLAGGAVMAAIVAFIATSYVPDRFISEAVIDPFASLPECSEVAVARSVKNVPTILSSASVLATALSTSGIPASEVHSNAVKARAAGADGMITLSVAANSASQAQRLAQAVLEATYAASRPQGDEKARLEVEQQLMLGDIQKLEAVAAKLKSAVDTVGNTDVGRIGDLANGQSAVIRSMLLLQRELKNNQRRLEGLTVAAVVKPPSLPTQRSGPQRITWIAVAILGTISMLLIGIFVREAWRSTPIHPQQAARIGRLREKFGLTPPEQ